MHAEPTRWRRATVISVGLHAALALLAWSALGPGDAQVYGYEPHAGDAPAEIIPIELPVWQRAESSRLAEPVLPAVEVEPVLDPSQPVLPAVEVEPVLVQQPQQLRARPRSPRSSHAADEPVASRARAGVRRDGPGVQLSAAR